MVHSSVGYDTCRTMDTTTPTSAKVDRWRWWLVLLALLLVAALRLRLAATPLERDEGEYAYGAQLLLGGGSLYRDLYTMKPPGVFFGYAGILTLFGESVMAVRLGLLMVNALTTVLLFLLAWRWAGAVAGVLAAWLFAWMSLSQGVQGVFANAEHFVLPPILLGLLAMTWAMPRRGLVGLLGLGGAGMCLGFAILVKHHAGIFVLLAISGLIGGHLRHQGGAWRSLAMRCGWLIAGILLPLLITLLAYDAVGHFDRFWFWTVRYPRHYVAMTTPVEGLRRLAENFGPMAGAWVGAVALAGYGVYASIKFRRSFFVLGFLALSIAAVCPGWYFRPHYFVLLLPAWALAAALGGAALIERFSRPGIVVVALTFTIAVGTQANYLLTMSPLDVVRTTYPGAPFVESMEIARFVRQRTTAEDLIAVLGSEPQIYFYARRLGATSYIYGYPLMENHPYAEQMQEEMIRQLELLQPQMLIYVRVLESWGTTQASPQALFQWLDRYAAEHYRKVGLVDLPREDAAVYAWDEHANRQPLSDRYIVVLERRQGAP